MNEMMVVSILATTVGLIFGAVWMRWFLQEQLRDAQKMLDETTEIIREAINKAPDS